MPIPEEYRSLVERLHQRTREGTVQWKSDKEGSRYYVSFQHSALSMSQLQQLDFSALGGLGLERPKPLKFALYNDKGEVIDSFTLGADDDDYDTINELWRSAHRKAMRVDEAIRRLEAELEDTSSGKDQEDQSE